MAKKYILRELAQEYRVGDIAVTPCWSNYFILTSCTKSNVSDYHWIGEIEMLDYIPHPSIPKIQLANYLSKLEEI